MLNSNNYFRGFCIQNFPFLEKEFDALTDYQLICKIFEHFENEIKAVDEKYSNLGNVVSELEKQFNQLKLDINNILQNFQKSIQTDVDERLKANYNQIVKLLSDYQIIFNNEISNLRNDLEKQIKDIELGKVIAYNPTNGLYENVSKVILDIYEILRQNAITVDEFESLNLTAEEFDNKELTAYNFDVNGKIILIPTI